MKTNTYPLHLEKRLDRFYGEAVQRLISRATARLLRVYRIEVAKAEPRAPKGGMAADDLYSEIASWVAKQREDQEPEKTIPVAGKDVDAGLFRSAYAVAGAVNIWSHNQIKEFTARFKAARRAGARGIIIDVLRGDEQLQSKIQQWSIEQVSLIKDLEASVIQEMAQAVEQGFTKGLTGKELAAKLQEVSGASKAKARFWARDQMGSLNGQVDKYQQQRAGYPGYTWQTSRDAKVRDSHAARQGRYYLWGHTDLDPGLDYNCRCTARPALGPEDQATPAEISRDIEIINSARRRQGEALVFEPGSREIGAP